MKRWLPAVALLFGILPSVSFAQEPVDHTPRDSTDILVLEHDFTGPGEFARVVMLKNEVYRAELSTQDAAIDVYPIKGGSPVFINPEEYGAASGQAMYTIYPTSTAEYQFRLIAGGPVVRLRLFRDLRRSRRRQKIIDTPGWEIGAEAGIGGHSGYLLNTEGDGVKDTNDGGVNYEGCFSARSGPGILNGVSGCAFGIGWDARGGTSGVAWFFIEPRIRLIGGKPRGVSNNEIGILGRASYGLISRVNRDPKMLTIGVYATRNIRWNAAGKGLGLTVAYRYGWINNLGLEDSGNAYKAPTTGRLTFSIGYYQ